ncbi:MAG TPA: hypothetical protein VKX45_24180 [Bryobacteraceae bacterium]|jgi:hypothetical protein|nr:hypothetical protein [Bryobacteraceae bacterium]
MGNAVLQKAPDPEEFLETHAFCKEKYMLLTRFLDAVKKIGRLHQWHIQAVIHGVGESHTVEALLQRAGEEKNRIKAALLSHIEAHGC